MDHYLFIVRSITQAQQATRILERSGISSQIFRAPGTLTDRGCSYAVQIRANSSLPARQALQQAGLQPLKIVRKNRGVYQEEPL
jgi:adenylate cyclase class IV